MSKRIVVDPVTRIEGHLRIDCEVDGGRVSRAWSSGQMWRGIELILEGRDPLLEAQERGVRAELGIALGHGEETGQGAPELPIGLAFLHPLNLSRDIIVKIILRLHLSNKTRLVAKFRKETVLDQQNESKVQEDFKCHECARPSNNIHVPWT